jgi:hypothetical protein
MKKSLLALIISAFALTAFAADQTKAVQNETQELNCVKKDKNGKCPPAPKSPKPTPKKKAEAPK